MAKRDASSFDELNGPQRAGHVLLGLVTLAAGGALGALTDRLAVWRVSRADVPGDPPPKEPQPGFETEDWNARAVTRLLVGLGVILVAVVAVVTMIQYAFMGYIALPRAVAPSFTPPANATLPQPPRPEEIPGMSLQAVQARENAQLNSYGWADQNAGTVHIPITRAMEIQLQKGYPVAPQDAARNFNDAGNVLPSTSSSGRTLEQVYP